jgi:hypothetical protein
MSFCGQQTSTSLTDTDLQSTYGTSTSQGLLPPNGFTQTDRDNKGLLKRDVLKTLVSSMTAAGKIPKPPPVNSTSATIETYMKKNREFIEHLKVEYCFYDSRYKYALNQLFNKLKSGYAQTDITNQSLIQKYLEASIALNMKLNDLSQIMNEITVRRLEQTQDQNSDINSINQTLESRSKKLSEQYKILSSQQATALLYKDMVKYSKERADSTNNILQLYSFMNIVMIGMLVYLYRSMGSE